MSEYTIRPWQAQDQPRLKALWQEAFGDDEEYIDKFFSLFLLPESCLVAEAEGQVVSAMYILNGPLLFMPAGKSLTSAYLYALATDPAWRGRGIGTAVYKACVQAALDRADAACVLPSEPGLYPFYEKASGCVPVSYARQTLIPREEVPALEADMPGAKPISAGEYYLRRKNLLRGYPYTVMNRDLFALEGYQMQRFGGGLFDVGGDIAAVEMDGGTCRVLELLTPEGGWRSALAAVAAVFPAERYLVRSPLFFDGPGESRPFMLASTAPGESLPVGAGLWWSFAFD